MEVGLETLQTVGRGRERVAVLGEMRELGSQAAAAHRHIGAAAAQSGVSALWCCGAFAAEYEAGARAAGLKNVAAAPNSTALAPLVAASVRPEMVLLIKGSRGARMERVVDALLAQTAAKAED
jgi:UDP-N-acetylmuramyl pentapeptide synthase